MNDVVEGIGDEPSDGGQEADDVIWQRTQAESEEEDEVIQS